MIVKIETPFRAQKKYSKKMSQKKQHRHFEMRLRMNYIF